MTHRLAPRRFLGVQSRKIERSSRAEERGAGGGRTSPWGSREAGRGAARQVRRGAHQQWRPGEEGAHGSSRGGGRPADGGDARRPARREKMAGDAENGSTTSSTSFAHDESTGDVPWPANRSFPRSHPLARTLSCPPKRARIPPRRRLLRKRARPPPRCRLTP